jgi:hypothetical protein
MTVALIVILCVVIFIVAFLVPLMSRRVQRPVSRGMGAGARAGRKLPGPLGFFASRSMGTSRRAFDTSGGTGRRLRGRLPF